MIASVKGPDGRLWASWIVADHKHTENRTWTSRLRGPLFLHAGGTLDEETFEPIGHLLAGRANLPRQARRRSSSAPS